MHCHLSHYKENAEEKKISESALLYQIQCDLDQGFPLKNFVWFEPAPLTLALKVDDFQLQVQ